MPSAEHEQRGVDVQLGFELGAASWVPLFWTSNTTASCGEARGEARAVLTVLEGRGVAVPDDVRDQILDCTDLDQLDTWLRRAINATTIDDVLGA